MVQWYFQGPSFKQMGPVSAEKLHQLADSGDIVPDTLVRRETDAEWVPARTVSGVFAKPHVAKPAANIPVPPPLPRRRDRRLVPVLLSILTAVVSASVVLQACILWTLAGIASKPMLNVGSAKSTDHGRFRLPSIPVEITNRELDVNVDNPRLYVNVDNLTPIDVNVENSTPIDVNVENSTPIDVNVDNLTPIDVNVENHLITESDPIPVRAVR